MSAFSTSAVAAVHILHATFGDVGQFTAPPAGPIPVTVILTRHDEAVALPGFDTQVRAAGWQAQLRQAQVPTRPRVGTDTITVNATLYQIRDVREDAERTEWVCDLG